MPGLIAIGVLMAAFLLFPSSVLAQPQKSRVAQTSANRQRAAQQQAQQTSRASLMYPTAVAVPDEVPWRRDIYRSLDLEKDENAALYYPVEPQGNDMNLFTLLFRLLNTGKIPAYEYKLDGVEDFSAGNRMHFKDLLDRYSIFYEVEGNNIKIADADVPSAEVLSFYVKESSYYDQNTATYHTRVTALCPVLHRADDFSMDLRKYPLFWVRIEDVEPYLAQKMVMTSNLNNAARMSMADYFATNKYKGTIYMTTNMQGKSLQQQVADRQMQMADTLSMADPATVKQNQLLRDEQNRIEAELTDFEEHIWNTPVDSAELARQDSVAAANAKGSKRSRQRVKAAADESGDKAEAKAEKSSARVSRASRSARTKKEKEPKSASSSSSSGAPRVSVRRQRH